MFHSSCTHPTWVYTRAILYVPYMCEHSCHLVSALCTWSHPVLQSKLYFMFWCTSTEMGTSQGSGVFSGCQNQDSFLYKGHKKNVPIWVRIPPLIKNTATVSLPVLYFSKGYYFYDRPNSLLLIIEPVMFINWTICGRFWGKIGEFCRNWPAKRSLVVADASPEL
jgi:hypothetical protein